MIYFVSGQSTLFESEHYKIIGVEESLLLLSSCNIIQFDSETLGLDPHIGTPLMFQLGSKEKNFQIVIDATTINILLYKEILETKFIVGQNLKFDLQWLYNYGIVPRKVYDTMIVEQFLYLGYSKEDFEIEGLSMALDAIAYRRLGIVIDKSVRGEIYWTGITERTILYGAKDVQYLEDIMWSQINDCKQRGSLVGAKLECDFTPVIAYLEWCGIKLDENKWKAKMKRDEENLIKAKEAIDNYVVELASNDRKFLQFIEDTSYSLFGDELGTICKINWGSSEQVIPFVKLLGFDTSTKDKKTGEDKDTALEKELTRQKGVDDKFLGLMFGYDYTDNEGHKQHYWGYQECRKLCTTYGQGHLNAINPNTGRLHTVYRAIGTASGRMSSGSKQPNKELAKLKGIQPKDCKYPNMQQLPHDKVTRACFVAEEGNLFCSCDYAAMEARIGADVYNEKMLLDEFLTGSGDTHAAYAKVVFADELKAIDVTDIKKKRPDLRNKVKAVEFAVQFGSDGTAVAPQLGISVEEARQLVTNLLSGMKGLASFKKKAGNLLMQRGYVEIMPQTGHRAYWHDFQQWKERQKKYDSDFWEDYRLNHKGTGDKVAQEVKMHFKAVSKWRDRMSLNLPTQGGGAIVLKDACIEWFNWVVDNGYFGKIKLVNLTHDEHNSEFPEELKDTYPKMVEELMEKAAAKYFHKLPIPAESAVEKYWVH